MFFIYTYMMNPIFGEEDKSFKLTTFRKITHLLNKIDLFCDFAFTDESGYNRHLSPSCSDSIFHDIETGNIYVRLNLHTLELDLLQEISKYKDLILSIIYNKIDYKQIEREIKLIQILD